MVTNIALRKRTGTSRRRPLFSLLVSLIFVAVAFAVEEIEQEEEEDPCGSIACLNGGNCVVIVDDATFLQTGFCDCAWAGDDTASYAGTSCQYESTAFCSKGGGEGLGLHVPQFCVNGGLCRQDELSGCVCPPLFFGKRCEYLLPEDNVNECTLQCANGGSCFQGSKVYDQELLSPLIEDLANVLDIGTSIILQQHCACPRGFLGLQCDHSYQVCGDGGESGANIICLHGSTCVEEETGFLCDCSTSALPTEGRYCQDFSEEVEECDLICQNGGICNFYDDDFDPNEDNIDDIWSDDLLSSTRPATRSGGTIRRRGLEEGNYNHYCRCQPGYEGSQCEYEQEIPEDCILACQNGGFCDYWRTRNRRALDHEQEMDEDGKEGEAYGQQYCICPGGYIGDLCEESYPCTLRCQNDGTCTFYDAIWSDNEYVPADDDPLVWDDAVVPTTNPAKRSGGNIRVLDDPNLDQFCRCHNGYDGFLCEEQLNCGLPCQNGGKCSWKLFDRDRRALEEGDDQGAYCSCPEGHFGNLCQEIEECTLPCQNGGNCYYFRGESWVDDGTDDFLLEHENNRCECPPGFYGSICQYEYQGCARKCLNGGICSGSLADDDQYGIDDNAYAGDDANDSIERCICLVGFFGMSCEILPTECTLLCMNGGTCSITIIDGGNFVQDDDDYEDGMDRRKLEDGLYVEVYPDGAGGIQECVCPPGFSGTTCDFVEPPECTLDCNNGGMCAFDTVYDFEDDDGETIVEICTCPSGFTGSRCERPATLTCGGGVCQNGGTCIESGESAIARSDTQTYFCDCTTAYINETFFAGRSCQYESTSICNDWLYSLNGPLFCVNGGECLDESKGRCECPGSFSGSRCEFTQDEVDTESAVCSLQCANGGTCQQGIKVTHPLLDLFGLNMTTSPNEGHLDFNYCFCPDGYFGMQCEDEYLICGEREHICLNGGECFAAGGQWKCNCNETSMLSAGEFCERTGNQSVSDATELPTEAPTLDPEGVSWASTVGPTSSYLIMAHFLVLIFLL